MNFQFFTPPNLKDLFIISDTHAYHKGITRGTSPWPDKSKCRDFENENQMTDWLVERINKKVPANAFLLHLGDWNFNGRDKIQLFRERLNCSQIAICFGNHDSHLKKDDSLHYLFSHVCHYNEFHKGKKLICNFHFPIKSWSEMSKGSFCLSGHTHNERDEYTNRQLDCGVDMKELQFGSKIEWPYHIDEIFEYLSMKPVLGEGHHSLDGDKKGNYATT